MTLVVARQVDDEVYIVGDTKFTDDSKSETEQYVGGLKVVLLTPGLCVAFAGDVANARKAIQGIYDKSNVNLFDKNLVLDYFLQHHVASLPRSLSETTFILAFILEANNQPGKFVKEIFRIANSKINPENETTHIGDSEAFNFFQEISHGATLINSVSTFEISKPGSTSRPNFDGSLSTAMRAMQGVIDLPNAPNVDGYRTVVISEYDQFKYLEYVQVRGNAIRVINQTDGRLTFGGAEEGSDIKHIGLRSATGHGIFSMYSITGRFGLIYCPEKSFQPMLCSKCSADEFRLNVEEQIAITHQRVLQYQSLF